VFSNSTVGAGTVNPVVVDLGSIGRIELGAGVTVTLTFSPEQFSVAPHQCTRIKIRVVQGAAEARLSKGIRPLAGDREDTLTGVSEIVAQKGSILSLNCGTGKAASAVGGAAGSGGGLSAPLIGVISAVGAAGAAAVGVALSRNSDSRENRVSPSVP